MSHHVYRKQLDDGQEGCVVELDFDYYPASSEHGEEVVLQGVLPAELTARATEWFYDNVTMLCDEARGELL